MPARRVALVGDNGAGKSTLMKIITGVYRASGGEVALDGRTITGTSPGEIRALGIEMIYQNLELAREQDVTTNIFLGREPTRRFAGFDTGIIDHKKARQSAEHMVRQLGARVPSVDTRVGTLSGGQQQSVAIARALTFSPKVVIMDEPTAALAVREIEHVLQLIKELKGRGIGVILISHRLDRRVRGRRPHRGAAPGPRHRRRGDPRHHHAARRLAYRRRQLSAMSA